MHLSGTDQENWDIFWPDAHVCFVVHGGLNARTAIEGLCLYELLE